MSDYCFLCCCFYIKCVKKGHQNPLVRETAVSLFSSSKNFFLRIVFVHFFLLCLEEHQFVHIKFWYLLNILSLIGSVTQVCLLGMYLKLHNGQLTSKQIKCTVLLHHDFILP